MPLIDKTYFVGDINLAKTSNDDISLFITRFEKEVLVYLLGYTLYKEMMASPEVSPYKELINGAEYQVQYNGITHLVKWNGLKNADKVSLISYYVYCYYLRDLVSSVQSVGIVKSKNENSLMANPFGKIMAAWSNFEELYGHSEQELVAPSAYNFLTKHKTDYPNWIFKNLNGSMNSHDL